jgi:ankyrin repeat protein
VESPSVKLVYNEKADVVRLVFNEMGADVNNVDWNGRTALLEAVVGDKPELCKFLLDKGANINAQEYYRQGRIENGRAPFQVPSITDTRRLLNFF